MEKLLSVSLLFQRVWVPEEAVAGSRALTKKGGFMEAMIPERLRAIENDHEIKILFACESGSRGWGFPSPDSDYDVRFIYIRPLSSYLSIEGRKEELHFPISHELDICGWDLKKVLRLMLKSNTTPFEWLQSPIIYSELDGFRSRLWELCYQFYSRRAHAHHYLGIANGALEALTGRNIIKIKKLFYVLRPLLASKWCLERNEIAPMAMEPLMELLPEGLRPEVEELIRFKSGAAESHLICISEPLLAFIFEEKEKSGLVSSDLPKHVFSTERLNEFFKEAITVYDD